MLLVFIFIILVLLLILFGAIYSCNIRLNIIINNNGYKIVILVYIFGKICVYKTDFNTLTKRFSKKKHPKWMRNKKFIIKFIKGLDIKADKIDISAFISTTEVEPTAIFSGVLNSLIGIIIAYLNIHINKDDFKYKVVPVYSNKKVFYVKIKCIICLDLVHIISTINRCIKDWRCVNYGRKSSNRRAYGYRHE